MFPSNHLECKNLKSLLKHFPLSNTAQGIGDDASLITIKNQIWAISSDLSVEEIHHSFKWSSLSQALGKAIISNLSDIHAMGGKCSHLFFNLGANPNWTTKEFDILGETLKKLSDQHNFSLEGGDLTYTKKHSFFSFTAMGEIKKHPLLRSNAEVHQKIYLTGKLGKSCTGLNYLQKSIQPTNQEHLDLLQECVQHHLLPQPNLNIGIVLGQINKKIAAIDLSDGLSSELWHLAHQSKVKMLIYQDKLPIDSKLLTFNKNIDFALHGGEEYCLLFTANLTTKELEKLNQVTTCYNIGDVQKGDGVFLDNGQNTKSLPNKGWQS